MSEIEAGAAAVAGEEASGSKRLREWLDDVHRRTWELELLLSGAVVFALFRLPEKVDEAYLRLDAGLGGTLEMAAFLGWYYVKLILYTLIGAFLVHLVARAYWVGLVGLHAVYPGGPRFEKIDAGPLAKELYRRRLPSLERQIAGADRFASAVFSFSFAIILMFLLSIAYGLVLSGVSLTVSRLAFGGERFGEVFKVLALLVFVSMLVFPLVDRAFGARIAARGGRPAALLNRLLVVSYRLGGGPLAGPILLTLLTNAKKRLVYGIFMVTFVSVVGLFLVRDVLLRNEALSASSHLYLPADAGALEVDARHYDDRRTPGEISLLPSIPSEVVTGPFLRLFVPLPAEWTEEAVAEHCPGIEPVSEAGLHLRRRSQRPPEPADLAPVLACLGGLHEIGLNGMPLEPPEFFFHTERGSGVRGLVALLPAGGLPTGANLLTLRRRPLPDDRRPPREHFIRFWR